MPVSVQLAPVKEFARRRLSAYPITRRIILQEPDEMPAPEFVAKCRLWLQLLELDQDRR
jgi:hypothetical protein